MNARPPAAQRGTTLLEALIAFLVLSFGMLAAARVQTHLRTNAELTRARAEAVRIGEGDLEQSRTLVYADIADATTGADGSTHYTIERRVDAASFAHAKAASVTVHWNARDGSAQTAVLHSILAEADPAYAGTLAVAPGALTAQGAYGRSVRVPLAAQDLGNGRSALKPVEDGTVALVFDNVSGLVVARCTGVTAATRNLAASALAGCTNANGLLLSGSVRFAAAGAPPDPAAANDTPLALDITIALTGGTYTAAPQCSAEAKKTVRYAGASGPRIEAVPLAATPASWGLVSWTDTGDRHVAYHCVVHPLPNGQWSGSATIVPHGWTIGAGSGDRRICRYSADLDASGAIDANIEHPASYANVSTPLAHQNFLVVRGSDACPAAGPVRLDGDASDVFVDLSTIAHQPS